MRLSLMDLKRDAPFLFILFIPFILSKEVMARKCKAPDFGRFAKRNTLYSELHGKAQLQYREAVAQLPVCAEHVREVVPRAQEAAET